MPRLRLPAAALAAAAVFAVPASAATTPADTTVRPPGAGIVESGRPRLSEADATRIVLGVSKIASWLERYPSDPRTAATFDEETGRWRVSVWSGRAGEIARGTVEDSTGRVVQALAGPQVGWGMARGRKGQFGGDVLLSWPVWVALSAVFFAGLGDLRRPLSLRNLDLLALLSFGVSLAFFNDGRVIQSAGLAAPPLAYLAVRFAWAGLAGRAPRPALRTAPVWVLAVATVFLLGFRIGTNVAEPTSVIDVGYAGVIGGHRILHGEAPYGHMPVEDGLPTCGSTDTEGRTRDRVQTNGRCESANAHGDTYGPLSYGAYVPFVGVFGWSGRWDRLWAAHAASIAFDLLVVLGLGVSGLRLAGVRLGVTLAFGWAAYPFTAYALNANTNDALMPAILVWGFVLVSSPWARGMAVAGAGFVKLAAFILAPLWLGYGTRLGARLRPAAAFAAGFAAVAAVSLSVLLLEPSAASAASTMWERTVVYQLERSSPFSPWDWGQYHAAGVPALGAVQTLLQVVLLVFAGALLFLPCGKGPFQLAALTAALLLGFQLVLTHWSYLYLPWALPFVLLALLLPVGGDER